MDGEFIVVIEIWVDVQESGGFLNKNTSVSNQIFEVENTNVVPGKTREEFRQESGVTAPSQNARCPEFHTLTSSFRRQGAQVGVSKIFESHGDTNIQIQIAEDTAFRHLAIAESREKAGRRIAKNEDQPYVRDYLGNRRCDSLSVLEVGWGSFKPDFTIGRAVRKVGFILFQRAWDNVVAVTEEKLCFLDTRSTDLGMRREIAKQGCTTSPTGSADNRVCDWHLNCSPGLCK